jgi:type IV pilus assembly protein PilM
VQLAPSKQGWDVQAVGYAARAPLAPGAVPNGLGSDGDPLFRDRRFRGRPSAVNLYMTPPIIRYVELPPMPDEELAEAVRWQAKKLVQLPIEQMVLDYLQVGEVEGDGGPRIGVLVVLADRAAVKAQYQSLMKSGVQVSAVDVTPLALFNAVKLAHPEAAGAIAFAEIGAAKTEINVAINGVLRFTRTTPLGGKEITAAIERVCQVSGEEAEDLKCQVDLREVEAQGAQSAGATPRVQDVVKQEVDRCLLEIQRSLDYCRSQFRDHPVAKLVLMGGTPLMTGFVEYASAYFEVPVVLDDPFAHLNCGGAVPERIRLMGARFSACVGMALRAA